MSRFRTVWGQLKAFSFCQRNITKIAATQINATSGGRETGP